ncbi:Alpha/Beta hydrolase protein, partial [Catenaria anguillulae PL171]
LLLLAAIPSLQRLLVYMSWINYPWGNLANPTAWGFRPDQARSLFIPTPDNLSLGAWHIVQPNAARAVPTARSPAHALPHDHWTVKTDDTVFLYLHGNAGNRGLRHRRAFYQTLLTAHMRARRRRVHLLAIDYRGFGDSSAVLPSEAGLKLDALAAWTFITRDLGAQPSQVVVVGHSLGTGVATALVHQLSTANTPPRGLVLLAPFTSIPNAAIEYPWVPVWLLGPFKSLLTPLVHEKWESIDRIPDLACNVLIVHGSKDIIINQHHAHALFKR